MKSVGKLLHNARKREGYTIEDVNRAIKIHPKYIKALEADDYTLFEGSVHAKGFLKIYTDYLGLDLQEVLALWRREYAPDLEQNSASKFDKIKALEPEKFVITPGILISVLVSVILVGFFTFLFFQYKDFTDSPTLDIFHPEDNVVSESDVLDITGRVELDSEVFINSQKIITNPDGSFLTSIKLREGINTISVKAVNKLNKETETLRTIIYRPDREEPTLQVIEESTADNVEVIDEVPIEEEV